jgi:predicted acyltransferase
MKLMARILAATGFIMVLPLAGYAYSGRYGIKVEIPPHPYDFFITGLLIIGILLIALATAIENYIQKQEIRIIELMAKGPKGYKAILKATQIPETVLNNILKAMLKENKLKIGKRINTYVRVQKRYWKE